MKIAICGTYSSGKTTTALALSYVTGIEMTHSLTMREIMPRIFPDKKLEDCVPPEIVELIFERMIDRVKNEMKCIDGFISDGSSIQEWAYCRPRLLFGMNPIEANILDLKKLSGLESFGQTIDGYGEMGKEYASKHYDAFVHLPIEFPLVPDGHRPVSESFRKYCDQLLREVYPKIGIPVLETKGDIFQRLMIITRHFNLPHVRDIHESVMRAKEEVKSRFDTINLETQ